LERSLLELSSQSRDITRSGQKEELEALKAQVEESMKLNNQTSEALLNARKDAFERENTLRVSVPYHPSPVLPFFLIGIVTHLYTTPLMRDMICVVRSVYCNHSAVEFASPQLCLTTKFASIVDHAGAGPP
jgi:hypothetical protein